LTAISLTAAEAIETLLAARSAGATICPSEAARLLAEAGSEWRDEMERVHLAARELAASGHVTTTWRGAPRSAEAGPYRIGRP